MGREGLQVSPQDGKLYGSRSRGRQGRLPARRTVTAKVEVTDAQGNSVSAEVSITAADEGVLSLIGYQTPDPIPTFYALRAIGVTSATQLEFIRASWPHVERPATGGDAAGSVRSRFAATAV